MSPTEPAAEKPPVLRFLPTVIALLPIALLTILMLRGEKPPAFKVETLDLQSPAGAAHGVLLRPIGDTFGFQGIALDGGELPFLGEEVPRLLFGHPPSDQPLRVAFFTDWTSPACRDLHRDLLAIAASLPAFEIYLLPIAPTPAAEATHRAVLAINRTANIPQTFETLVAEILNGSLAPEPTALFKRLATLDPELSARLDPNADWIVKHADTAFALARAQLARNRDLTSLTSLPQLATFDAALTGNPTPEDLAGFLRQAAGRQSAWLKSNSPILLPGTIIRCDCRHPSHRHSLPMAMEFQLSVTPPIVAPQ